MKEKFSGIFAALITPYTPDQQVDYTALRHLVRKLIHDGIDGFYVCGSTSEVFLLNEQERKKILETVVDENNGEKRVICHTGAISTEHALDFARHAESVGADAVSSVSPFYYKFSEEEIVRFYLDLMAATDLPMFVYNIPSFSGFSLTEQTLSRLKENTTLAGVKFTSSDYFLLERIKTKHPDLVVWNGFDEMLLSGLSMGADGGIGSTYNCMPKLIRRIYDSFLAGDMASAQIYQKLANEVIEVICRNGVFASVKELLGMEGIACNGCRKPFSPLAESGKAELRAVYEQIIAPLQD